MQNATPNFSLTISLCHTANTTANIPAVSQRLAKVLKAGAAKAGLNQKELAQEAGVPYGWVRQVMAGGIMRPDANRLAALADVLPVDLDELLALSDQLGAATRLREGSGGDQPALIAALQAQTEALNRVADRLDLAAQTWQGTAEVLGPMLDLLRETLARGGQRGVRELPPRTDVVPTGPGR